MDRLINNIKEKGNPSVVGLDPVLDYIPSFILNKSVKEYGRTFTAAAKAILEYNKGIIDAVYDIVPALKPQSAYYEMYGYEGVEVLEQTICYAKEKGMYIIADCKRNDIGSTATAYATAYLGDTDLFGEKMTAFNSDSITINGYLGSDGILPFYDLCKSKDKTAFVLVKTSNPSSGELQDLTFADDDTLYVKMAKLITKLSADSIGEYGFTKLGAVVGATYKKQLEEIRAAFPSLFFLIPGYGAQGGDASGISPAFNKNGLGGIVNSSRAIMCAYKKGYDEMEYQKAARDEALRMKNDIVNAIK